jgi:hypothetical protein
METNHWSAALTHPEFEGILFVPLESLTEPPPPGFIVEKLCGDGCNLKRHSRYRDELRAKFAALDNPATPAPEEDAQ